MPASIILPRLGWSMDQGTFIRWLKQPGELVRIGEPLFELEGEKAIQEIEAVDSGVLHISADSPAPGSILPVGAVLGLLLKEGEAAPAAPSSAAAIGDASQTANCDIARSADLVESALPHGSGVSAVEPRSDTNGPVSKTAVKASPRARRLARTGNLDWATVQGTGRSGRVRERDVRAALERAAQSQAAQSQAKLNQGVRAQAPAVSSLANKVSTAASLLRSNIARRMRTSLEQTAPVTLTTRADATNLVGLREQFRSRGPDGLIPSYTDIVAKVVALTLRSHPRLNARWEQDQIIESHDVHIGIAVDTEHGLLVPVLRDVLLLSLREVTMRSANLIRRARDRKLPLSDLQGGTFTITNLGQYGIDAFTPIINYPETAILGIGAIRRVPVVLDDHRIVSGNQVILSLTFDHRIVDGAPAARFLKSVVQAIESPAAWLLDV